MAIAPSGELTSFMLAKESVFATSATATNTQIADDAVYNGTNEALTRDGAKHSAAESDFPVGRFVGRGTASVEFGPDTAGAWLLLLLGAESIGANASNPTVPTGTPTLTGSTAVGATVFPFSSATGYVAGNGFRVDNGLVTQEDFVIASVATNNVTTTAAAKYQHASAAAIAPCTLGQDHTFIIASPRLSYTAQINRGLNIKSCFGAKVTQGVLSCAPKAIMAAKFDSAYVNEAVQGSPVTPTYPTTNPFIFQTTSNLLKIGGVTADATCMGWSATVQTGVQPEYPKFGGGRFDGQFPEVLTVVTLQLDMAFETLTQEQNFYGGVGLTGPGSSVPSIPVTITCNSPDFVNASVPYGLQLAFIKAKFLDPGGPSTKSKDYLKQSIKARCVMSSAGANDSIKAILTNASSANSL